MVVCSRQAPHDIRAKGPAMKRILLFSVMGTVLLLFSAPAWAFGVKDVVKMSDAGVPDSLIVMKIENSGKTFKLSAEDIEHLRQDDVSDEVISAMLQTEGRDRDDDYYRGYYYHPYPYYSYPYSRVYVGFGYRYGGRHFYGSPYYGRGYYPRRYQPYSGGNFGDTRYRGSYGSRQPSGSGAGQYRAPTSGGTTSGGTTSGQRSRSGGSGTPSGSGTRTRTR